MTQRDPSNLLHVIYRLMNSFSHLLVDINKIFHAVSDNPHVSSRRSNTGFTTALDWTLSRARLTHSHLSKIRFNINKQVGSRGDAFIREVLGSNLVRDTGYPD
jgi:hypothetical protein